MARRNLITYKKPDPIFLRRIREQVSYKEGPNINTKKEELTKANKEDYEDKDGEKPTVVLLKETNVSKEEAEDFIDNLNKVKQPKILFKKPIKTDKNLTSFNQSTLKRTIEDDKHKINKKKVKNVENRVIRKNLLSFGNEDEVEEEEYDKL